jgi:D-alanyl-D-alanine carboxypeptidase
VFEPGTRYDYSNTNTVLLGMVVERVTRRPLDRAFRALLFAPLGLSHTTYPRSFALARPSPTPYEVDPGTGQLEVLPEANLSSLGASGAIVTTLPDLLRWGRALGTGLLIGPRLLQLREGLAVPATNGPEYDRYGLGIGELNGWWGHTGEGFGFQAATFYDPVTRSVIAVALNSSQPENIATQIFKALADVVRPG